MSVTAYSGSYTQTKESESVMDEEAFNVSMRKFLKMVGVNSQREIEQAVAKALEAGKVNAPMDSHMTLEIPALGLKTKFDGKIALE